LVSNLLNEGLLIGHRHAKALSEQGCVVFQGKMEDQGCRRVKENINYKQ